MITFTFAEYIWTNFCCMFSALIVGYVIGIAQDKTL